MLVLGTNIAVLLDCSKSSRQCSLSYLLTCQREREQRLQLPEGLGATLTRTQTLTRAQTACCQKVMKMVRDRVRD